MAKSDKDRQAVAPQIPIGSLMQPWQESMKVIAEQLDTVERKAKVVVGTKWYKRDTPEQKKAKKEKKQAKQLHKELQKAIKLSDSLEFNRKIAALEKEHPTYKANIEKLSVAYKRAKFGLDEQKYNEYRAKIQELDDLAKTSQTFAAQWKGKARTDLLEMLEEPKISKEELAKKYEKFCTKYPVVKAELERVAPNPKFLDLVKAAHYNYYNIKGYKASEQEIQQGLQKARNRLKIPVGTLLQQSPQQQQQVGQGIKVNSTSPTQPQVVQPVPVATPTPQQPVYSGPGQVAKPSPQQAANAQASVGQGIKVNPALSTQPTSMVQPVLVQQPQQAANAQGQASVGQGTPPPAKDAPVAFKTPQAAIASQLANAQGQEQQKPPSVVEGEKPQVEAKKRPLPAARSPEVRAAELARQQADSMRSTLAAQSTAAGSCASSPSTSPSVGQGKGGKGGSGPTH